MPVRGTERYRGPLGQRGGTEGSSPGNSCLGNGLNGNLYLFFVRHFLTPLVPLLSSTPNDLVGLCVSWVGHGGRTTDDPAGGAEEVFVGTSVSTTGAPKRGCPVGVRSELRSFDRTSLGSPLRRPAQFRPTGGVLAREVAPERLTEGRGVVWCPESGHDYDPKQSPSSEDAYGLELVHLDSNRQSWKRSNRVPSGTSFSRRQPRQSSGAGDREREPAPTLIPIPAPPTQAPCFRNPGPTARTGGHSPGVRTRGRGSDKGRGEGLCGGGGLGGR